MFKLSPVRSHVIIFGLEIKRKVTEAEATTSIWQPSPLYELGSPTPEGPAQQHGVSLRCLRDRKIGAFQLRSVGMPRVPEKIDSLRFVTLPIAVFTEERASCGRGPGRGKQRVAHLSEPPRDPRAYEGR